MDGAHSTETAKEGVHSFVGESASDYRARRNQSYLDRISGNEKVSATAQRYFDLCYSLVISRSRREYTAAACLLSHAQATELVCHRTQIASPGRCDDGSVPSLGSVSAILVTVFPGRRHTSD